MRGPNYFGPFMSQAQALRFYDEAHTVIGETVVELGNLAQTIDEDDDFEEDAVSSHELAGEA